MRPPQLKICRLHPWLGLCCAIVCLFTLLPALHSQQQSANSTPNSAVAFKQPQLSPALNELLRNGWGLFTKHQDDAARELLVRALTLAREEKNDWGQGEAHRILGQLALRAAKYPDAQTELTQALTLFESVASRDRIALVHWHLGDDAFYMGKRTEAADLYRKALSQFEALGDLRSQASVLENLEGVETIAPEERKLYTERGLILARKIGDKSLEGAFLHHMGDALFTTGDFAGAIEKLKEAAACFEEASNRSGLAYLWTSMGRLYRAHGAFDEAISYYQKGLTVQEELGDKFGVIQSLNAMAVSYGMSGHSAEAMDHYERALALARNTGSPSVIAFIAGNVGYAYDEKGNHTLAIQLLEEALRLDPSCVYVANRYMVLSQAYRGTGQYQKALENSDQAVRIVRGADSSDFNPLVFLERARVYRKLASYPEALADIEVAMRGVERLRAKLVPADYLKQGYAEQTQDLFAVAIQIHEQLGEHKQAMLTAEEARARAFLDLMASRGLEQKTPQKAVTPLTAANDTPDNLPSRGQAPSAVESDVTPRLATRGAAPLKLVDTRGAPMLASPSSAAPPTFEELLATAKRLDSTLLSYWVTPDTTFIWVLRPDGVVRSERAAINSEQLSKLIRQTSYAEEEPSAEPAPAAKAQSDSPAASATVRGPRTLRLRGGGELVLGGKTSQSWRELYKLLILPVQDSLPSRGSHLTIVPQGPLFRLSFAALQDAQGYYLVENYALNYAPSLGVLRLTGERRQRLGQREPRYLIVADPLIAPDQSKESNLPPLPGARQEARNLVRLLPRGETTLLMGSDATKQAVREGAAGKTVLHLATHAIVRDDQPLDSFLALSAGDKSPPGSGRLTVQEIYGMDLETDLVVLSACSTALGKLSGDGMAGLTRAFFYGGAPSVMATLWDVADEPTSLLISEFYKSLQKDPDKSRALRAAQLRVVRELRAGRVQVNTTLGPVTLPEDPAFWAGFVLQGEP
jgi:CHAT domain-containing protein/tetratricopeptide (TPR) repeat protein